MVSPRRALVLSALLALQGCATTATYDDAEPPEDSDATPPRDVPADLPTPTDRGADVSSLDARDTATPLDTPREAETPDRTPPRDTPATDTGALADSGLRTDTLAPTDTAIPTVDTGWRCASDRECAGHPEGAVCDTTRGRCVQCVAARDTCPSTRYCDDATHTCVAGCRSDLGCSGATPYCEVSLHSCVACASDDHCGPGRLCVGRACVTGCSASHACPSGLTCCAGACVDPAANPAHCGRCDAACSAPRAVAVCQGGRCAVGTCVAPWLDCDGDPTNGCEVDSRSDAQHCGACGRRCGAPEGGTPACVEGGCTASCPPGRTECGGVCQATGGVCVVGIGECRRAGTTVCSGVTTACSVGAGAPAEEGCNGLDDDCDGSTDEGLSRGCYTGPAGTSGVGRCRGGAQVCARGSWGVCAGEVTPRGETCDLTDEDCDGRCDDLAGCRVGVHRALRDSEGDHFYTLTLSEASCCGYRLEHANFYYLAASGGAGLASFYRCLRLHAPGESRHFYTTDPSCEGATDWVREGALGFIASSPVCGAVPLYRLMRASVGDHFYTTSEAERDYAVSIGYRFEFIAGYVWTAPQG